MNNKLREIVAEIERERQALYGSVEDLSQAQLDLRPDTESWSAGELLHHLYLSETSIIKMLAMQTEKAGHDGLGADVSDGTMLGSLDRFGIETVTRKVQAPEFIAPQKGLTKEELLAVLKRSRAELLAVIERAAAYDLSQLVFPHPMLGQLNLYQWILFIGKHEQRHRKQIMAVRTALGFPVSGAAEV